MVTRLLNCSHRFVVLTIGIIFYLLCVSSDNSIRAVFMLTRHGDRSPLKSYPKDLYGNDSWPTGFGVLTPKGMHNMYIAGVIRRDRYQTLLNSTDNVILESTEVPRCIKSARLFVKGFLDVNWSRDKVSVPSKTKNPIAKPCQTVEKNMSFYQDNIIALVGTSDKVTEIVAYIEANTGLNLTSIEQIYFLDDTLRVQLENGLTLPDWVESIFDSFIRPIADIYFYQRGLMRAKLLRNADKLTTAIRRMEEFISGVSSKNVLLFSAHDMTIAETAIHLDIIEQIDNRPNYGASIALELHENQSFNGEDYEIKIFYFRSALDDTPLEILIPNCEQPCPFRKFKNLFEGRLFRMEKECDQ